MELRHLRYFVAVADAGNVTKAAHQLRVAQPALSRQIRQLEDELGVGLFARGPRGVQLTTAGTAFLAEARALLAQSEQAVRTARSPTGTAPRPLDVGYVWGLFHSLVPALVARYRQGHPDAAVNLFDLAATEQADALAAGRLDLGFIGLAHEADACGLSKREVGACEFVAVLPERHPAGRRRVLSLSALAHEFFVVISEKSYPGAARVVTDACAGAGFRPRILQSAERGHTLLALVAGGCGVALLPASLRALPHAGVVFRSLVERPTQRLFVAWSGTRPLPRVEAFLAHLPEDGGRPPGPRSRAG